MNNIRAFTTDSNKKVTALLLNRMYEKIDRTTHLEPHPGLIIATHHFKDPSSFLSSCSRNLPTQSCYHGSLNTVWLPFFLWLR